MTARKKKEKKAAARHSTPKPAPPKSPRVPKPEEVKAAALELRDIRKAFDRFKRELRLSDDGAADPYLRERLFTDVVLSMIYDGSQDTDAFLKEAREQKKVTGKGTTAPEKKTRTRKRTPLEEAREVRRRWRQLHGLDDSVPPPVE